MSRNSQIIIEQQTALRSILQPLLPKSTSYALIDFPDHSNVGDSAIWLGEIKLLKEITGNNPVYVSKVENFDFEKLTQLLPEGPILIHGGGNFGDIWRKHQDFREYLMKVCKGRRLIQMPQSLKFSRSDSVAACADLIRQHGDFHLLVRDQPSFEFASQHFPCHVALSPDCAFGLGAIPRPTDPVNDIFMLMRTDSERADYDRAAFDGLNAVSDDWLQEPSRFYTTSKLLATLGSWKSGKLKPTRLDYYQTLANGRLMRGLTMLSSGKQVITDRLHAHILCTLLDIPHVALDNNYGKVSGYINAWTKGYTQVETATSASDAVKKLSTLASN